MPNPSEIRITNPMQALFGMLWGVWFGTLTHDVLFSTTLSNTSPVFITLDVAKIGFVFSSPIVLTFFVSTMTHLQDEMTINSSQSIGRKVDGLFFTWDFFKNLGILIFVLGGFLVTTFLFFSPQVNSLYFIFGMWQAIVWVFLEVYLIKDRANYQQNKDTR